MSDPFQDPDQISESEFTTLNFKLWFVYRFAEAEEMGGVVSFLVSEDASYITGENFLVAGGMNARLWKKGKAKRSLWRETGRKLRSSLCLATACKKRKFDPEGDVFAG